MNYYGYMFGDRRGLAVVFDGGGKEESFAEHDRHYHPDGYKEGDKCTKRERLEKEDSVSPTDAPEITMEEIRKRLKDEYGVTLCDFDEANEVVAEHGSEGFKKGWEMVERPTDAEFKETAGRVLRVLDDLNERFHYKPPLDYLFCVKFKEMERNGKRMGIGGLSEEDHIWTNLSKMAIAVNPPEWAGMSFGHEDFDEHRDAIIRHEIGHVLATKDVLLDFFRMLDTIEKIIKSRKGQSADFLALLSRWASESSVRSLSREEIFSEMFSRITDKNYSDTEIPEVVASLFSAILNGDFS